MNKQAMNYLSEILMYISIGGLIGMIIAWFDVVYFSNDKDKSDKK